MFINDSRFLEVNENISRIAGELLESQGFIPSVYISISITVYFLIRVRYNLNLAKICLYSSFFVIYPIVDFLNKPFWSLSVYTLELKSGLLGVRIMSIVIGISTLSLVSVYANLKFICMLEDQQRRDKYVESLKYYNKSNKIVDNLIDTIESEEKRHKLVSSLSRSKSVLFPELEQILAKNDSHISELLIVRRSLCQYAFYASTLSLIWLFIFLIILLFTLKLLYGDFFLLVMTG
jgi:hypothetical protein